MFKGKVKAATLNITQHSGSIISISGVAKKTSIEVASGAIIKGYEFTTDICKASATTGGTIQISIIKELDARSATGGSIHYKGTPEITDINVNTGGVVKKS
jgi:hypothetical protein